MLISAYKSNKVLLLTLLLVSLGLRIFVASDNNLHTWDERYHALVAKNLVSEPLKPTLYKYPLLPYNVENWVANHVWLEKGPIPLWSMACSIKLFGINEFAIRFPSLIISVLGVWLTFLTGKKLFDEKTGLVAAGFHSINGLLIEVAGGRISSDHVETFFVFFIQLAAFLVILVVKKRNVTLLSLLAGIATGIAFLCKWTPSLIIFPIWIVAEYYNSERSAGKALYNMALGVLGFALTVLPWLLYINTQFPVESSYVFKKFLFAFSQPVEQHSGPVYYYFQKLGMVYGELIWIPIIGSFYFIFKHKSDWRLTFLNSWFDPIYNFFSWRNQKAHLFAFIRSGYIFTSCLLH